MAPPFKRSKTVSHSTMSACRRRREYPWDGGHGGLVDKSHFFTLALPRFLPSAASATRARSPANPPCNRDRSNFWPRAERGRPRPPDRRATARPLRPSTDNCPVRFFKDGKSHHRRCCQMWRRARRSRYRLVHNQIRRSSECERGTFLVQPGSIGLCPDGFSRLSQGLPYRDRQKGFGHVA